MRASIQAQGFTALTTTYDDGSLTLALIDANGHTLAVGQWDAPEPIGEQEQPQLRPADAWTPRVAG